MKENKNHWEKRGYVLIGDTYYPPGSNEALIYNSTPNTVIRKIRTTEKSVSAKIARTEKLDPFLKLCEIDLGLRPVPEYRFSKERRYRLDYAFPDYKLGLEVDGGIYLKGNSGHSSGKGIKRDQEKASLLASMGWLLIRITPAELTTSRTIQLIKDAIETRK